VELTGYSNHSLIPLISIHSLSPRNSPSTVLLFACGRADTLPLMLYKGKTENGVGTGRTRIDRCRIGLADTTPIIQGSEDIFDIVNDDLS